MLTVVSGAFPLPIPPPHIVSGECVTVFYLAWPRLLLTHTNSFTHTPLCSISTLVLFLFSGFFCRQSVKLMRCVRDERWIHHLFTAAMALPACHPPLSTKTNKETKHVGASLNHPSPPVFSSIHYSPRKPPPFEIPKVGRRDVRHRY